MTAYSAP